MIRVDYVEFARFVFEQGAASTPEQLGSIFSALANTAYEHGVELMEGEALEHPLVTATQAGKMADTVLAKAPQAVGGDVNIGNTLVQLFLSTQRTGQARHAARLAPL